MEFSDSYLQPYPAWTPFLSSRLFSEPAVFVAEVAKRQKKNQLTTSCNGRQTDSVVLSAQNVLGT